MCPSTLPHVWVHIIDTLFFQCPYIPYQYQPFAAAASVGSVSLHGHDQSHCTWSTVPQNIDRHYQRYHHQNSLHLFPTGL